jgi:hypothetical protein
VLAQSQIESQVSITAEEALLESNGFSLDSGAVMSAFFAFLHHVAAFALVAALVAARVVGMR